MGIDDDLIVELKSLVDAANKEFGTAIAFHESWRPMNHDIALLDRMGTSRATRTFLVIKEALRREVIMSITRMWDTTSNKGPKPLKMTKIADILIKEDVVVALAKDRAERISGPTPSKFIHGEITQISDIAEAMCEDMADKACEAVGMIRSYMQGGKHWTTMQDLKRLRNEQLAHHQLNHGAFNPRAEDDFDKKVEDIYQGHFQIISQLLSVVQGVAYKPEETADIYKGTAELFWTTPCGERNAAHPNYRASKLPQPPAG